MTPTKKYSILIITVLFPVLLRAQIITGKVMHIGTNTVIANASVYFSGSVKGTRTDSLGMFKIFTAQTNVPIIVSCVGYFSATVMDYTPGKPCMVYLKPKENIMRMVQIGNDGMTRLDKIKLFKREFLGTSAYANNCTITNMDDIDLIYTKKKKELNAFCNNPIIVKNKLLAYTLTYYLDNFSCTDKGVLYTGNFLFKDDMPADAKEVKKIQRERERVYSDSRMHLIRALWKRGIDASDFSLYNNQYEKLPEDSILVANEHGDRFIKLNGPLRIVYRGNAKYISTINQKVEYSYINEHGFYSAGLAWSGPMSAQRIGDMLPYEYVSVADIIANKATSKP